jgi:hypothetical protein
LAQILTRARIGLADRAGDTRFPMRYNQGSAVYAMWVSGFVGALMADETALYHSDNSILTLCHATDPPLLILNGLNMAFNVHAS